MSKWTTFKSLFNFIGQIVTAIIPGKKDDQIYEAAQTVIEAADEIKETIKSEKTKIICLKCGFENPYNANYCIECGTHLISPTVH